MATKKKTNKPKVVVPPPDPEDEEIAKRMDWERNQDIISNAYFKLSMKNKKFPSLEALAKDTGLSTKTVHRHLTAQQFEKTMENIRATRPAMAMKFMAIVSNSKNPNMWDLWWTLTEKEYADSKRKKNVDITSGGEKINDVVNYSKLSTKTLQELIDASETPKDKS